jgi:pseudouridine-5'-phosphate glycosidase
MLETQGVPVLGYQTDEFPAFYQRSSGVPVPVRVETPEDVARIAVAHWSLGGAGLVLAAPVPAEHAMDAELEPALVIAHERARQEGVRGAALTPFLLAVLAQLTAGRTLQTNRALIVSNAALAAQVALVLSSGE